MRGSGPTFGDLLLRTLCASLAIAALTGCERAGQTTGQNKGSAQTRPVDERLLRVWTLLGEDDPNSFREALRELATLPPEVYHDPPYGVDGPPEWNILRIGDAAVRLDNEWMKATARGFFVALQESDPQQTRQHYEVLDALLAGVMRAARNWTARRLPGSLPPDAYDCALGLRAVLAFGTLKSKKYADDAEFEQLLKKRVERLKEIMFSLRISRDVP